MYMPTHLKSGPGLCSVSYVFSGMFPPEARFFTSRMMGSNEQMHMTCLTPGLTLVRKTTGCPKSRGPASTTSPVTFLVSYRTQLFLRYPWSLWTLKLSCTVLVMGLMVPVSFSIFPQTGRVSVISSPCEKSAKFTIHFCKENNIIYIESHPPDHLCSFGFCFSSWYIRSVFLGLENNHPLRYFK